MEDQQAIVDRIFANGGEMGELMRSLDWSQTLLGPVSDWSQSLKTTVSILLNSRYPMFVWWGENDAYLYNDAYRPILGIDKHPQFLGQSAKDCWAEIWAVMGELADQARSTGQPAWSENLSLIIERNGYLEEVYFTFSYSPIRDEVGAVGGVFCICTETTHQVLSERRLRMLRELAANISDACCLSAQQNRPLEAVCTIATTTFAQNPQDIPFALIYLLNKAENTAQLVAHTDINPEVIASLERLDLQHDDRLQIARIMQTGEAVIIDDLVDRVGIFPGGVWNDPPQSAMVLPLFAQNQQIGWLILGISLRRAFDQEYRGFFELIASNISTTIANVRAYAQIQSSQAQQTTALDDPFVQEAALRENGERLQLAVEAGRMVVWEWNPFHNTIITSSNFPEIYGISEIRTAEQGFALIYPEDRDRHQSIVENAVTTQSNYHSEFRFIRPDTGAIIWLEERGKVVLDDNGNLEKIIGITIDISDLKRIEQDLRENETQFRLIVESAKDYAIITLDLQGDITSWNVGAQRLLGYEEAEIVGQSGDIIFTLEDQAKAAPEREQHLALTQGQAVNERWHVRKDSSQFWGSGVMMPLRDENDRIQGFLKIMQDKTEQRQIEAALQQSENRYRTLANAVPQLMWINMVDGRLEFANEHWYSYIGLNPQLPATLPWADIIHPDELESIIEIRTHAIAEREPYEFESRIKRYDGIYRWHLTRVMPLKDESNQVLSWYGTATDIHDTKQLSIENAHLYEQAEQANRIKDEFLAVLSHELRTPLNPILGWVKLLRTGRLDPQRTTQALETIERNTQLQSQLIEDLLDVSRILRGKLSLNMVPVNLANIIRAAIDTVRLAAEAKALQVQTVISDPSIQVLGDAARLQQIVWNLLSNAIKFTPENGQIEIRLACTATQAQIQVQDTGKGITPAFLPYVFEHFRQADATTTRKFGGLGLGLAIVRNLVELHGGTVKAESPGDDQGATFTVSIPRLRQDHRSTIAASPTSISSNSMPLGRLRVLVVDDEGDSRDVIAFIVEQAGGIVTAVESAIDALQVFTETEFDVLLSDIGMPDMNGYMLMQQIRSMPQGDQIRAIALTAYAGEIDQQQALKVGFQAHLAKPVDPDALIRTIVQLCGQQG